MQHAGSIAVVVLVLLFAIYRRVRRTVGYQPISRRRIGVRLAVFVVLAVMVVAANIPHWSFLAVDAVGMLLGAALAFVSMRTTTFEYRDGRWNYRQNMWVGFALLAVFLGRVVFRYYEMMTANPKLLVSGGPGISGNANPMVAAGYADPWTAGVFLVLMVYYTGFFVFLLVKERSLRTHSGKEVDKGDGIS